MKTLSNFLLGLFTLSAGSMLHAQICTTPKDTVYGLTSAAGISGQIVAININNGGTRLIGSPATSSVSANGLGYSQVNGRFYFFNQTGAGTTEFVSYNPLTNTKIIYGGGPPSLPTGQKVRSGTVNKTGTGYYTIYPGATTAQGYPINGPAFYYFNIGSSSWTLITQTFKDVSGNVVAPIQSLNSGDMAFDGNNNLWMLSSNTSQFALYRIKAPLPTSSVASVIVDTIIPVTSNPVSGVSFTGIAFNSLGKLYLTTGSGAGPGTNTLYVLTTPGSPLTTITTIPNSYGDDLTSCSFPAAVLAVQGWSDFIARLQDEHIKLAWTVDEDDDVSGYHIEFSTNGSYWQTIGYVARNGSAGLKTYGFMHDDYNHTGGNYYRVVQEYANDRKSYSNVRYIAGEKNNLFHIGPNPAKDVIFLYNNDNTRKQLAQIFDKSGRLVYSAVVDPTLQSINISHLSKGSYIIKLLSAGGDNKQDGYHFIKW
ncbi:MAG: T9SS type A sorting domain-containing protein [Chitinophagaceae bacterium]